MSSIGRWVLTPTGLDAAVHGDLFQFQLERRSFRDCLVVIVTLACPVPELRIFLEQELERFADDIGWVGQ
jgi:hypothetical protein